MPLPHLDLGHGAAGDVAPGQLQFGGEQLLGHALFFPNMADIPPHLLFKLNIHGQPLAPI